MKKLFLLFAMVAMAVGASAQIQWGVKGGLNLSNLRGDSDGDMKPSIYAGAFAEFALSDAWAIQPEVVYSRQGTKDGDIKLRVNYLNIPIMAKFYVMDKWSFEAGPQIGFKMNAKVTDGDNSVKVSDQFKGIDFSIGLGTSYMFTDNLGASARYNFGVSNVSDISGAKVRNNVFQVGAIWKF